jgi:pyocin large subunit-like protein
MNDAETRRRGRPARPSWVTREDLEEHFERHKAEMGARTVQEYDRSARFTIANGQRFTYTDSDNGTPRVGYFIRRTGLLTVLTAGERRILTHFKPTGGVRYVRSQIDSDYPS